MRALFPLSDRSRASIKDRNGARFNEQIRTYTRRKREEEEEEEEEMTRRRSASAMRICPATTRRSRNIRGRNVARISYTTTVGVIIVHGVETCQQQQRYPRRETKGSFHRRKREESLYLPGPTFVVPRSPIPACNPVPSKDHRATSSPIPVVVVLVFRLCNDQTINVSINPSLLRDISSLPNWVLKSLERGNSFVRPNLE